MNTPTIPKRSGRSARSGLHARGARPVRGAESSLADHRRLFPCQLLGALAILGAGAAQAQVPWPEPASRPVEAPEAGPALQAHAELRHEHDSNVLRAPQARSDNIHVLAAGLHADKTWSLQRVLLDLQARAYRFLDIGSLDYNTVDYLAQWQFGVTPQLQGVLQARRRQFRDITATSADDLRIDRRTERDELTQAAWSLGGGWEVLGGAAHRASRSDDPRSAESDAQVRSVLAGGAHEFSSGARLAALVRHGNGDYGNRPGLPDFKETEPALELRWPWSERTRLDARLARLRREHDREGARDFSGGLGQAQLRVQYSPKTVLEAGVGRDLGSYELGAGGSVRTDRWYLSPQWRPTAKTLLRLRHEQDRRRWQTVAATEPDAGRRDRWRQTALVAEWEPLRALLVSAGLRREHRASSLPAFDYSATVWSLAVRLVL